MNTNNITKITGKYAEAKVFIDNIEESAKAQIKLLCDQPFAKDSHIRIMPDCHAGAGCVIGFTAKLTDKVILNLVGVDIGCGVLVINIGKQLTTSDALSTFDSYCNAIPSGFNIRQAPSGINAEHYVKNLSTIDLTKLRCYSVLKNIDRLKLSMGTLGGGNHFIELAIDDLTQDAFLIIHSGSRNLGKQVAEHYQQLAIEQHATNKRHNISAFIEEYKQSGEPMSNLPELIAEIKQQNAAAYIPDALCYLTDDNYDDYMHDMQICQQWASANRRLIAKDILCKLYSRSLSHKYHVSLINELLIDDKHCFETVHNYISFTDGILRKGAVSAHQGEQFIIPLNMRDGSLICVGKGNPDWNYSAPHGAGRIMSRTQAKDKLSLDVFKSVMSDIYSTSVCLDTLDESPMAYKDADLIKNAISDTCFIVARLRPVYNFKAKT